VLRECDELRDRIHVFRDRIHAGRLLAELVDGHVGDDALVLAIPAGGVPVAAALADARGLPLDVAVVSKVTLPWNSEVGYGAAAYDGSVELNRPLVEDLGLGEETLRRGIEETRRKVARRVAAMRPGDDPLRPTGTAILVDDGLASGVTMRVAVAALRRGGAARIAVAVPTGSLRAVRDLEPRVDALFCANVRSGPRFAVAEAYQRWNDVTESEALRLLADRRVAP
jgi:predicted phosphoribosyltransferase